MRLLELHTSADGSVLEFHPNVTIVRGLSPAVRDEVIRAVTALPAGADPGLPGLVEAHGVLFDLTPETLELFGLDSSVDVLVRPEDLPGRNGRHGSNGSNGSNGAPAATAAAAPAEAAPAPPATEPRVVSRAREELEDAREAFGVLEEAHGRAERQSGVASDTRQKIMAALDGARRERDQARARLDAPEAGGGTSAADIATRDAEFRDRIAQLEAARDELAAAVEELKERDPRPIQVLVDEYKKPPSSNLVPSREAIALADEFADLQTKLADLEARREAEGRGTESALRRLDEARAQLAEAERAVAKPEMQAGEISELEAAHEEVLEAEKKASGRLGRKSGQKLLEAAQEKEQQILDRVGFPTWSSYVMGSSLLNIDPVAEQSLERCRDEMVTAEAAWEELTQELENDPEYSELLDRLEAVYLIAFDILGGNDEGDLEYRLREVMVPEEEVPKEDVIDTLAYQLGLVGVDVDEQALPEVVVHTAEDWLQATMGHWEKYRALLEEHERVENALTVTERELELFGVASKEVEATREERMADLQVTEAKVAEILSDLEQATELESELVAQLDARTMLLGAARFSVRAAEAKLAELEANADAGARAAVEINSPEPKDTSLYDSLPYAADDGEDDDSSLDAEALQFYFVARLAALRSVSHAGSVPLLIDDALAGLSGADTRYVLEKLDEMSESVQVIYLTEDEGVASWADTRGIERAVVVRA